jgi:NAD(P)-dependent dehydrogenase (short-subunit alcohol dehydrogenase family)
MPGRLEGKIAIVTGAGSVGPGWGNGRATVVRFAQEGAKVFAVEKNPEAMKETLERAGQHSGAITTHVADATKSADIKAFVALCREKFGRIDILVNNVGGSMPGGAVELAEEAWDQQFEYNVKSVFLGCKHVLPVMEAQGGGAIVNLSSTSGIRWSGSPHIAYATSKAGIIQFSRMTATQYASKGIRVNTVVPGLMHTPMVEARLAKQRTGGDVEKIVAQRLARIPLGFAGDGRDVAAAILFLASDEARFFTGTEILVDGGMSNRCD